MSHHAPPASEVQLRKLIVAESAAYVLKQLAPEAPRTTPTACSAPAPVSRWAKTKAAFARLAPVLSRVLPTRKSAP